MLAVRLVLLVLLLGALHDFSARATKYPQSWRDTPSRGSSSSRRGIGRSTNRGHQQSRIRVPPPGQQAAVRPPHGGAVLRPPLPHGRGGAPVSPSIPRPAGVGYVGGVYQAPFVPPIITGGGVMLQMQQLNPAPGLPSQMQPPVHNPSLASQNPPPPLSYSSAAVAGVGPHSIFSLSKLIVSKFVHKDSVSKYSSN